MQALPSQTRDSIEFRPVNQVKKPYAKPKEHAEWDRYEPIIRQLHSAHTTRERMVEILRTQHGFSITKAQLDPKLKLWDLHINVARPSNTVHFESPNEVLSSRSISPEHDGVDEEVVTCIQELKTAVSTRSPEYLLFGHPYIEGPPRNLSESCHHSFRDGEAFDDHLDTIHAVFPMAMFHNAQLGLNFKFENRREYLVDVQVARDCFMNLWTGLKFAHLPMSAISVADFLCASRMFQEAFEIYVLVLDYLLISPPSPTELIRRSIIDCLRTATTGVQQSYALRIANLALMGLKGLDYYLNWFRVSLNLYKNTLKGGIQSFVYRSLHFLIEEKSGKWLSDKSSRTSRREFIAFGIRLFRSTKYGTVSQLVAAADLPKKWTSIFVLMAHLDLHEDHLKEKIGERLLARCRTIFYEESDMLNQALSKWFTSDCPAIELRDFLADVLYCFMLQFFPYTELRKSASFKSVHDSAQFTLFEAIATLAPLIAATMTVSATPAAEDVLQSVDDLLRDSQFFNETFMQAYWSRMIESASSMDAEDRRKGEVASHYLLNFACTLYDRSIHNIDMFHVDEAIADLSLISHPNPAAFPKTAPLDRPMSANDPILYQRSSETSSLSSRLSDQFRRISALSAISKRSKVSSDAMSLESRDSWKLKNYLQISDRASSRGSGMSFGRDRGIDQIPEHPAPPTQPLEQQVVGSEG